MIQAVLVDDEKNALEMLEWQLQNFCPGVVPAALCTSADDAISTINRIRPQLVFLDIEMPHKNGFEMLAAFPQPFFEVIFTTAYDQFALKAFKVAALDYLLKPIDAGDLQAAVARCQKKMVDESNVRDRLNLLLQHYESFTSKPARISLATAEGIFYADPALILCCEATSNYTKFYFRDESILVVSKTLKDIEAQLAPFHFLRVHHSFIVNIEYVRRYVKADGGYVELNNGKQLPVSRQRRNEMLRLFNG